MIIGIGGKKRAGKDYIGSILAKYKNATLYKFAERLYEYTDVARSEYRPRGRLAEMIQEDNPKMPPLQAIELANVCVNSAKRLTELEGGKPRKLLQFIGTEVFRDYDPDYWVNILWNNLTPRDTNNAIITDVRFPNEAEICDETIYVLGGQDGDDHSSEAMVPDQFDFVFDNINKTATSEEVTSWYCSKVIGSSSFSE